MGDFDADGHADLAISNADFNPTTNGTVTVLLNDTAAVLGDRRDVGVGVNPGRLAAKDVNGDGKDD